MSYAMEQPIAVRAAESARAGFIRRTYAHLAGAILAFAAIDAILLNIPAVNQWLENTFILGAGGGVGRFMWLFILIGFMVVSWVANAWAHSDTSRELQYAGLAIYTLAEALIFLPLLYIANRFYPGAIGTAGVLTIAVFGALTLTVFVTRKDFSFLRPILLVGSFLALGFILAGIFFGFGLGTIFCFAMVALISGYILFYTSAVLHHYRTDQHVAASLALFSSIATLFWYILQIVMSAQRD